MCANKQMGILSCGNEVTQCIMQIALVIVPVVSERGEVTEVHCQKLTELSIETN